MQQFDLHPGLQFAIEDAHVRHHAFVGVEIGIKSQRLQRWGAGRFGRRDAVDDRLQDVVNAEAFLCAGQHGGLAGNSQDVLELRLGLRHVGVGQINFVDHRDDRQVLLHRQVHVRHRLRFDPLRRVDDQQRPFAGAQAAGDFVRKVHVPRGIDEVQLESFAIPCLVEHGDGVGFDRDAPFAFQVHRIEQLILHVPGGDGAGAMEQPVRKRRFPMVDMGDDAEVSDVRRVHCRKPIIALQWRQ